MLRFLRQCGEVHAPPGDAGQQREPPVTSSGRMIAQASGVQPRFTAAPVSLGQHPTGRKVPTTTARWRWGPQGPAVGVERSPHRRCRQAMSRSAPCSTMVTNGCMRAMSMPAQERRGMSGESQGLAAQCGESRSELLLPRLHNGGWARVPRLHR